MTEPTRSSLRIVTDLEPTDLHGLAAHLREVFRAIPLDGFVVGRTRLRDAACEHLNCSQAEGERIIETMIERGMIAFERTPDGSEPGGWHIHAPAPAD